MAYRLLLAKGEWDVDAFFRSIPSSKWQELKVAQALIDDYDAWLESADRAKGKPYRPPSFGPKPKRAVRRTLSGRAY